MSTIVTRSGKGVPLTATDHDNNVNNLNTDKVETLADLSITSTATEINLLDGVTATTAELNYVDGVTSAIQTQLGAKLPLAGGTMTGTIAGFTSTGIDDNATSTAITIDASKNVGIGVVPKSWYSAFSALQLGSGGAITYDTGSGASKALRVFTNCYRATDGNYKYIYGDEASLIESYDGKTFFKYAAAGSAGGTITWTTSLQLTNDGRGLSQFTAKAWVNFNGTGTVAIRDSHNVSSITDNGTGTYTVNYSNNLANVNYSAVANSNGSAGWTITDSHAVGSLRTLYYNSGGIDTSEMNIQIFGD